MFGHYNQRAQDLIYSVRKHKEEVQSIDRELSNLDGELFRRRLFGEFNIDYYTLDRHRQEFFNRKRSVINAIADKVYNDVSNILTNISTDIRMGNFSTINDVDNALFSISLFINEYYPGSEIKNAIIDKFRYSMIGFDLSNIENQYTAYCRSKNPYLLSSNLSGISAFKFSIGIFY